MKMRKLLAAGVAATMAVTSMATVASAEETTFNMGSSKGVVKFEGSKGVNVGIVSAEDAVLGLSAEKQTLVVDTSKANILGMHFEDKELVALPVDITSLKLEVTGIKGKKSNASKTYTYDFDKTTKKHGGIGIVWTLDLYNDTAENTKFVASQFVEITEIKISFTAEGKTTDKDLYAWFQSGNEWDTNNDGEADYNSWGQKLNGFYVKTALPTDEDAISAAVDTAINMIDSNKGWAWAGVTEKSTKMEYPFLRTTDGYVETGFAKYSKNDDDDKLTRFEIKLLSNANEHTADGYQDKNNTADKDGDQTYDDDTLLGTAPAGFSGFASQVADFFTGSLNGKITFKFTTAAAAGSTDWVTGGIPSTQTGIKNFLGDATANDFALFFNYKQTGSLQAVTNLDKEAGTVEFAIDDVLEALDGHTVGIIDNIYYGLTKGVEKDSAGIEGLYVESVTLSYDEDTAADEDIEDDTADEDDDIDADDADDDADEDDADEDDADEDDDASIDEDDDDADEDDADEDDADDDDEDDSAVNGDVVTDGGDDDTNPATGVALAVVPALVAAAAAVVSKKRK